MSRFTTLSGKHPEESSELENPRPKIRANSPLAQQVSAGVMRDFAAERTTTDQSVFGGLIRARHVAVTSDPDFTAGKVYVVIS
jgi:hypothetical protein